MKCVYNDVERCNLFTNEWANGICTNNEDCPYRSSITNADKIRAMTDDMQLAIFFASVSGCPYDREIALDKCKSWSNACVSCWLDWLNAEAEGE